MTKRRIRENLYIMLFQTAFYPEEDWMEQAEQFLEDLEGKDATNRAKAILKERYEHVLAHLNELDDKIAEKSKGWKIERLATADLAILRLAVFEMFYDAEVPDPVAINEAVELAKKYGQDNSSKFINGILSTIEKEISLEKAEKAKEDT